MDEDELYHVTLYSGDGWDMTLNCGRDRFDNATGNHAINAGQILSIAAQELQETMTKKTVIAQEVESSSTNHKLVASLLSLEIGRSQSVCSESEEVVEGEKVESYDSRTTTIASHEAKAVEGDSSTQIGGSRSCTAAEQMSSVVGHSDESYGSRETSITGNEIKTVGSDSSTQIGGSCSCTAADQMTSVAGHSDESYGSRGMTITGNETKNVGGGSSTQISGSHSCTAAEQMTSVAGHSDESYGSRGMTITGNETKNVGGLIDITASSLVLKVGEVRLAVAADGVVTLTSPGKLVIDADLEVMGTSDFAGANFSQSIHVSGDAQIDGELL